MLGGPASAGPLRCRADIVATLSMPGDATTLPLRGSPAGERRAGPYGWLSRRRAGELAGADAGALAGALALAAIVALSLFVVLMAANRPSILTPTTHVGYFPRWMAGPLGGLLHGFTQQRHDAQVPVHGARSWSCTPATWSRSSTRRDCQPAG